MVLLPFADTFIKYCISIQHRDVRFAIAISMHLFLIHSFQFEIDSMFHAFHVCIWTLNRKRFVFFFFFIKCISIWFWLLCTGTHMWMCVCASATSFLLNKRDNFQWVFLLLFFLLQILIYRSNCLVWCIFFSSFFFLFAFVLVYLCCMYRISIKIHSQNRMVVSMEMKAKKANKKIKC